MGENYNTKLDKKAVLLLILYIWIIGITIAINKDSIKDSYKGFSEEIISNLVKGYKMMNPTTTTTINTINTKDKNDFNQTRKISTSK